MKKGRKNGFTLIELLVVIGIICILAGMLLAGIAVAIRKGKVAATRMLIKNMDLACRAYFNDWGKYPPDNDLQGPGQPDEAEAIGCMYKALYNDGESFSRAGAPGWGPYLTMELRYLKDKVDDDGDGNWNSAVVIDSWDNTIFYDNNWTEGTDYRGTTPGDDKTTTEFDSLYTDNNPDFDFFSKGPDGSPATADDICNWAD